VADYELVQEVSDGVIVIARPDHSERKLCLKALLTVPKDKLLGVVLNCVDDWFLWRTNNYSYYSQPNSRPTIHA
jgi:Mrp family chromosome partitioning ATPase